MKHFIKSLLPPIILKIIQKCKQDKYGWKGDYACWQDAKDASTGYDAEQILQVVRTALLKVKNGEAIYERDSVLFNEIQYSWPLLSGLLFSAVRSKGLNIIDFGGSLGSTYYQNKSFLDDIDNVSWNIVEQKHFVEMGKKEFEDERLKFFFNVDECLKDGQSNLLLLSSVIQYIDKPYKLLSELLKNEFEYIVVDRTPFSLKQRDQIKLQVVPPNIYPASYPCWFFDKSSFINYFLSRNYKTVGRV